MAPRSGKRRRRGLPPMPIWLPLHRPCLRSMNVPGAYYMPVPEMYLPHWVLPPPYFSKPMCHCGNDDFCTPNNCRNSADCRKSNPMFCPHGTRDGETDSQQNTILEDEEEYDSGVDICTSCRTENKKRRMASFLHGQANGTDHASGGRHEDADLGTQDTQSSLRDFNTQREDMPFKSTEQGIGETESRLFSPKPHNKCSDPSCKKPYNSRDSQTNSTRSSNLQRAGTKSDVMTDQAMDRFSSGYAADSELSDTKRMSNGINKVSACTGCSEFDNPSGSTSALRNDHYGRRSRRDDPFKNKIHIDQLPDQVAHARKQGNQSTCCMSPPGSESRSKIQTDGKIGSKDDRNRKGSSGSRKSECECSTFTSSEKKTKAISNLKMANHKATSCECRFPPAFNHLGCSGNHGITKCSCTNNKSFSYSK